MICVFGSFLLAGQRVIAEFGIGLASAVLLDAFILRTILVPAAMHLFGNAQLVAAEVASTAPCRRSLSRASAPRARSSRWTAG